MYFGNNALHRGNRGVNDTLRQAGKPGAGAPFFVSQGFKPEHEKVVIMPGAN